MSKNKILPISVLLSAIMLATHALLYKLSGPISEKAGFFTYVPKLSQIDDLIPIVPVFITVYVLAYVFWFVCPIINSMASRERYSDYMVGFAAAYIFGFIWLCLFPAVMDRSAEGIVDSLGDDIFSKMHLWFITYMDSGEIAHGLLPSFHSMSSAYCYFGVMGCRDIPKALRIFVFVFSAAIVLSTLFLKQHYILDAVAGIGLAAIFYALSRKFHWGRCMIPLLERAEKKK